MNTNTALTNMIKQQLRTGDVLDEEILDLFEQLPRDEFVPTAYKDFAYSDMQIPLAQGQTMMTPLEEGQLLQSLQLTGEETVLEVGTGSGYLTALLAKSCKKLISIDIYEEFTHQAKTLLDKFAIDNVETITGDAHQGWMEKAPYDVIVLTGAIEKVTKSFKLQLMKGGKLFAIVGQPPAQHGMLFTLDNDDSWHEKIIFETSIAPLIDKTKHKEFIF